MTPLHFKGITACISLKQNSVTLLTLTPCSARITIITITSSVHKPFPRFYESHDLVSTPHKLKSPVRHTDSIYSTPVISVRPHTATSRMRRRDAPAFLSLAGFIRASRNIPLPWQPAISDWQSNVAAARSAAVRARRSRDLRMDQ